MEYIIFRNIKCVAFDTESVFLRSTLVKTSPSYETHPQEKGGKSGWAKLFVAHPLHVCRLCCSLAVNTNSFNFCLNLIRK